MARREVAVEPIEFLVSRPVRQEAEATAARKGTPHERNRAGRRMTVTFPDRVWREELSRLASKWGMNPSDVVTWCVSQAMAAIAAGEVAPPDGERRFYHRAGEMLELPWEPE